MIDSYYLEDIWEASPMPVFDIKKIDKEYSSKNEYWKPIIINNEKSIYSISSHGRILNTKTMRFVRQYSYLGKYAYVTLSHNRVTNGYFIHRLVAIHFIPIPKKYSKLGFTYDNLVVNHKNGYKWNNIYTNLEWTIAKENTNLLAKVNLSSGIVGENSHFAKMDNNTAIKCCEMLAKGMSTKKISEILNVSKKTIQHIKNRESWTTISKNYTFPKNKKLIPNSIPIETIQKVCEEIATKKYSDKEISERYGMSREHVRDIRLRKTQVSISKNYKW